MERTIPSRPSLISRILSAVRNLFGARVHMTVSTDQDGNVLESYMKLKIGSTVIGEEDRKMDAALTA